MTRVLIAIVANDAARFTEFWSCVLRLRVPTGSVKEVEVGGDWLGARNTLARRCLDDGFDYLWFMDDDHSFGPDMLEKLLVSAQAFDLPIVMPLCTTRRAPFHLVTYGRNPDESNHDPYLPISLEGAPGEGIVELEAGGTAGMLIRRDVLEAIPPPWFKNTPRSEDIVFCEDAKAAGFGVYGDLSCRLGHILTCVVTPGLTPEGWTTGIVIGEMQFAIGTAEQILAAQELPPEVDVGDPRNRDDNPHPDELPGGQMVPDLMLEEGFPQALLPADQGEAGTAVAAPPDSPYPDGPSPTQAGVEPASSIAERIEIWVDEELRWWWRAIRDDGSICASGSGVNEVTVLGAADAAYPGVMPYLIPSERHDSRDIRQYAAPSRLPPGVI